MPGPDNRLDKQVPFSANIGADYRASSQLSMGATFSYQAGANARLAAVQSVYNGPKRVVDVYGVWKLSPDLQMRVTALNLLHQDYENRNRYFVADSSFDQLTNSATNTVLRVTLEFKL